MTIISLRQQTMLFH